jgi:transglutaminase-like putative cysteine protease
MRLRVVHETEYRYGAPAKWAIQLLRLTPRTHEGQLVRNWRIDLDHDAHLIRRDDCYGNVVHSLCVAGPLDRLRITVHGEVETEDTQGVVRGSVERFPPGLFLRETPLTRADAALRDFAEAARGAACADALGCAHELTRSVHAQIRFDVGATDAGTTAVEAFCAGHGVCQDLTHIFIAAARVLGIPARYVSGYLRQLAGPADQDASHAWAEAYIPDLGWVGFDPTNGISPTDAYVRVAVGLDYLSAAPVRGARYGGFDEILGVRVRVDDAHQTQA